MDMMNEDTKSPKGLHILFVDDEEFLQELFRIELPRMGHTVTVCPDGETAIAALEQDRYDCLITDLDMPGMSGIELLTYARGVSEDIDAIILTGKSSLETAVAALRQGAFDYLTKPCKLIELESLLKKIRDKNQLARQYQAAKHQLDQVVGSSPIISQSSEMEHVEQLIDRVANTHSTVLVRGETGTGKELVARAVHQRSNRHEHPFVAVNCGALPENLIESELFGHCKGAFTGADKQRSGLFEVANHGTLLLDEIGELPKNMQAILLRVLESGEIRRVGDNQSFIVDVRVICATHCDLEQMVEQGEFREDLLFRINPFEIALPPLRQRTEDIPLLAAHLYCRAHNGKQLQPEQIFDSATLAALSQATWKGNVRELANVVEHVTILCDELPITLAHLPSRFHTPDASLPDAAASTVARTHVLPPLSLRELELQAIHAALTRHNNHKPDAAKELGVSLKTLYNKLNNQLDKTG
jgi:DNA-binding NtrC family response regulator